MDSKIVTFFEEDATRHLSRFVPSEAMDKACHVQPNQLVVGRAIKVSLEWTISGDFCIPGI